MSEESIVGTTNSRPAGERFHEETKYTPQNLGEHTLDWNNQPGPFKDHSQGLAVMALPDPGIKGSGNLWEHLHRRRSRRMYAARTPLDLETLAALLWATQGVTARYGPTLFRTAPSAGGLYPVETYLSVRLVEGLQAGIYHFRPHRFDLEMLRQGDFSPMVAQAALGQNIAAEAQVTFIWSAVIARSTWKYRQRAYRYIYIDAGHIAQNLYLAGEALGLGVCAVGAFFDDLVNELIGVDGREEFVIYLATVGKIAEE